MTIARSSIGGVYTEGKRRLGKSWSFPFRGNEGGETSRVLEWKRGKKRREGGAALAGGPERGGG